MPVHDDTGHATLQVIAEAEQFNQWMYRCIRPLIRGEVLEIGSGIGNISKFMVADQFSLTLSDYNPEYCALLKARFGQHKNVHDILQLDLLHPDFKTVYHHLCQQFDSLILLNVIEHLPDDARALQHCKFLLRQGGRIIVLAPAYNWLYCSLDKKLGHYRRYTLETMTSLFSASHFHIRDKKYFNFLGIAGWLIFGKVLGHSQIGQEMSFYNKLVPLAKFLDSLFLHKAGLSVLVAGEKL